MSRWFRAHAMRFGLAGLALGVVLVLAAVILSGPKNVAAAPQFQDDQPADESCLFCHQEEGKTAHIGDELLPITIDGAKFEASVHGMENIACVDCHTDISSFPHPEVAADSPRDYSLDMYQSCAKCHNDQYQKVLDSVHQEAVAAGNKNAAVCSDCHDPHTQPRITDETTGELLPEARAAVPQTCAQCHSRIYDAYESSVHGTALTAGDPNVPTCTDCHGVHSIDSPTTNSFRNSIPALCADCHTNEDLMQQYGISTNVLDTYVADFHGTTVKLFEETHPDQPTNKPVCTDCHGVHDILRPDDPTAGIAVKQNLLVKCQQCHPTATTESFTNSWLSHYEPSPMKFPIVYYVNLFYLLFIPLVLGGMLFFVLTDIYRRYKNRRPAPAAPAEGEEQQ